MELTGGLGADVAIEAVGVPETFELCTELDPARRAGRQRRRPRTPCDAAPGEALDPRRDDHHRPRRHGHDPAAAQADRRADGSTRRRSRHTDFRLGETMEAYDAFAAAAETDALKVVLEAEPVSEKRAESELPLSAATTDHRTAAAVDVILPRRLDVEAEAPARNDADALTAFFTGLSGTELLPALPRGQAHRPQSRRATSSSPTGWTSGVLIR